MGNGQQDAPAAPQRRSPRKPKAKAEPEPPPSNVVPIDAPKKIRRGRMLGDGGIGKTTGLTETVQQTIAEAVATGASHDAAFGYANVPRSTGMSWLLRGRKERARIAKALQSGEMVTPAPDEAVFLGFLDAVEHADAVSVVRAHSTNASIMVDPKAPYGDRLRASHFTIKHRDMRYVDRSVIDARISGEEYEGPEERTVEEQMAFHREVLGVMVANGLLELPGDAPLDFDEE
jgi:hypothetical protein